MGDKVLTITIAAYNVQDYLEKALESCLIKKHRNMLEVIIENDGSTDRTEEIAQHYQELYPDVFRLINKKNGGYGSTINTSIEEARGKYFKQLDGDDWYDTENLEAFVELLSRIDADRVFSSYCICREGTDEKTEIDWVGYMPEGSYSFTDVRFQKIVNMHCSTFRTRILRNMGRRLTEHCLYTDLELITYPLPFESTFYVWHKPVYMYRVGRDGQSISVASMRKHYKEHEMVLFHLIDVYEDFSHKDKMKDILMEHRLLLEISCHYRYLHYLDKKTCLAEMDAFTARLIKRDPNLITFARKNSNFVKLVLFPGHVFYPWAKKYSYKRANEKTGGE